jgi:hypothetical protein
LRTKTTNKSLTDADVMCEESMNGIVKDAITTHESKKLSEKAMSLPHRNMLRHGVLRVQKALQCTLRRAQLWILSNLQDNVPVKYSQDYK